MIEIRYPGVYLTEVPTGVHSIDGVSTSTDGMTADPARAVLNAPAWTDGNQSDPGITLVQLFAFLGESLLYRANLIPQRQPRDFLQPAAQDAQSDSATALLRKP